MPNWLNSIPQSEQIEDEFFGVSDIFFRQQVDITYSDHVRSYPRWRM